MVWSLKQSDECMVFFHMELDTGMHCSLHNVPGHFSLSLSLSGPSLVYYYIIDVDLFGTQPKGNLFSNVSEKVVA
jgi:hypothetical protein